MKKALLITMFVAITAIANADEPSTDSLQGSWRVVTFAGEPNEDEDFWEFKGNQFTQNLGGHRLTPDPFSVDGMTIDVGYAKIRVLEFDGATMRADMAGFEYGLEKQ